MATIAYELVRREKTPTLENEEYVSQESRSCEVWAAWSSRPAENSPGCVSLVGVLELRADRHDSFCRSWTTGGENSEDRKILYLRLERARKLVECP